MIAILGGLAAALAWAVSTLSATRASRATDPRSVVAGVALVGLVICLPFVLWEGVPASLDGGTLFWLVLAGAGNVAGLVVAYEAYRIGDVALVAPIVSTEGAIAALIAIVAGASISVSVGVTLAAIVAGIALAATGPGAEPAGDPALGAVAATGASGPHADAALVPALGGSDEPALGRARATTVRARTGPFGTLPLAGAAALAFGLGLYATGRVSDELPAMWVVISGRAVGTVAIAVPLLLAGRLRLPRAALPFAALSGGCEVVGYLTFTLAARHGVPVAAVLSSQFAVMAALGGFLLFGERLGRVQIAGVGIVLVGVSVLAALGA